MLTTEEIKKIFDNILDEDIELLGFDPQLVHPKKFDYGNAPSTSNM